MHSINKYAMCKTLSFYEDITILQQQAALMAAATQGGYINPMTALAATGQLPHALNGIPNPVVPPTSGEFAPGRKESRGHAERRDTRYTS